MQIQKLNDNSSWLLDFDGFRVLVDPWLTGTAVYFSPHFYELRLPGNKAVAIKELGRIDLLLLSNYLPDHCHAETLALLDKGIPVVAPKKAGDTLRQLGYREVHVLEDGGPGHPLLALGECRVGISGNVMMRDYLRAIFIHHVPSGMRIFYAPHGTVWNNKMAAALERQDMDGWDVVISTCRYYKLPLLLGGIAALGFPAAQSLVQALRPRYFINTHGKGYAGSTGVMARVAAEEDIRAASSIVADDTCQCLDMEVGETQALPLR